MSRWWSERINQGNAYFLTKDQEDSFKRNIILVKLGEIKEGTL